jgi:regulator of cell morphogenesis and NO signaling
METNQENILNVTLLEPKLKHPTIFKKFDELKEGESLTLHNDHDPKPLYYQLLGERGNIFTWEYLEEGPIWWKVKIRKRISGENEESLGEIAKKDLRKIEVFKKYGLDFSCDGKKTVKEACAEKGLDVTKVEQELQQADKNPVTLQLPYDEWDLDFFVDFIQNTHQRYIRKNLPEITTYANKVMEVHCDRHPELIEINNLVKQINTTLPALLEEEENILFPKIKDLVQRNKSKDSSNSKITESLQNIILSADKVHQLVSKDLSEIRKLSSNFTLPEDACASYTLLFRMLDEFEDNTHLHIHLENNILFPKVLKLEKSLS